MQSGVLDDYRTTPAMKQTLLLSRIAIGLVTVARVDEAVRLPVRRCKEQEDAGRSFCSHIYHTARANFAVVVLLVCGCSAASTTDSAPSLKSPLVGTWRLTTSEGRPTHEGVITLITFTEDARVVIETDDFKNGISGFSGRYVFNGDRLSYSGTDSSGTSKSWTVTVLSLTESKLSVIATDGDPKLP